MPVNRTTIHASPQTVFAVLADPYLYEHWVVGASDIRDTTGIWPEPGSMFHHTQGVLNVGLKDTTSVVSCEPPGHLLLEVRARPLIVARVRLQLEEAEDGTHVTMVEKPVGGWLLRCDGRVLDRLIALRNAASLRRLAALSEHAVPG